MLLFDEMMRRNLLEPIALANYLTKEKMLSKYASITKNSASAFSASTYQLYEICMDRALDFVRAAIYNRREIGDGMVLDETLDLNPSCPPEDNFINQPSMQEEELPHEEDNDEDGDDARRTRRRLNNDSEFAANEFNNDHIEGTNNQLWTADEAVKVSIRNCREVYVTLIRYYANVNNDQAAEISQSSRDVLVHAADSLLKRLRRNFHGREKSLTSELRQKVVITKQI